MHPRHIHQWTKNHPAHKTGRNYSERTRQDQPRPRTLLRNLPNQRIQTRTHQMFQLPVLRPPGEELPSYHQVRPLRSHPRHPTVPPPSPRKDPIQMSQLQWPPLSSQPSVPKKKDPTRKTQPKPAQPNQDSTSPQTPSSTDNQILGTDSTTTSTRRQHRIPPSHPACLQTPDKTNASTRTQLCSNNQVPTTSDRISTPAATLYKHHDNPTATATTTATPPKNKERHLPSQPEEDATPPTSQPRTTTDTRTNHRTTTQTTNSYNDPQTTSPTLADTEHTPATNNRANHHNQPNPAQMDSDPSSSDPSPPRNPRRNNRERHNAVRPPDHRGSRSPSPRLLDPTHPRAPPTVKLLQWNCRGLQSLPILKTDASEQLYTAICLQETIYHKHTPFTIPGYHVISSPAGDERRGVALAISNKIKHTDVSIQNTPGLEIIAATLHLPKGPLRITNIYQHHDSLQPPALIFEPRLPTRHIYLGDFNAHHPTWCRKTENGLQGTNQLGRHLSTYIEDSPDLIIINENIPTHEAGAVLDLAIATPDTATTATWKLHDHLASDHWAIQIDLEENPLPAPPPHQPRWLLDKANWPDYQQHLRNLSRTIRPPHLNLDHLERAITTALLLAATTHIPRTKPPRQPTSTRKSWYKTPEVHKANNRVNHLLKQYRRHKTQLTKDNLRTAQTHQKQITAQAREHSWLKWCETFGRGTTKDMWTRVKKITNRTPRPPQPLQPQEQAQTLCDEFAQRSAIRPPLPQVNPPPPAQAEAQLRQIIEAATQQIADTDRPFTTQELNTALQHAKNTSPGEDTIPYELLRKAPEEWRRLLLALINKSLLLGRLPAHWKQAIIIPIPKPGPQATYRPITLLNCSSKIMERMILRRLRWTLPTPHPLMHGFVRGRSTTDAICQVVNFITDRTKGTQRGRAYAALIDLEKAFERANPTHILHALTSQGIHGRLLGWIRDYLRNRTAAVKFAGHTSEPRNFQLGTPQGSSLSPSLFNLLVDQILQNTNTAGHTTIAAYADDLAIVSACPNTLQRTLNSLTTACSNIGLTISTNKTKAMAFPTAPRDPLHINNHPLEWVNRHKYLGIILDSRMTFGPHAEYTLTRCRQRLNALKLITTPRAGASIRVLRTVYTACIRPLLEYAAPVLGNLAPTWKLALERTQRNALAVIFGAARGTNRDALAIEAGLHTTAHRQEQLTQKYIAKIICTQQQHPLHAPLLDAINKDRQVYTHRTWRLLVTRHLHFLPTAIQPDPPTPPWEAQDLDIAIPNLPKAGLNQNNSQAYWDLLDTPAREAFPVYTDASTLENHHSGAAVYSTRFSLQYRLSDRTPSFVGELVAIQQAITELQRRNITNATIFSDSKSGLLALSKPQPPSISSTALVPRIRRVLLQPGQRIHLRWIPAHVGLPGNERADQLAKDATTKQHIDIQTTQLSSPKLQIDQAAQQTWNTWINRRKTESTTIERMDRNTKHQPYRPKTQLPRHLETLLVAARTESLPEWYDHPDCPHCGLPDSWTHRILHCPRFNQPRNQLLAALPIDTLLNTQYQALYPRIIQHSSKYPDPLIRFLTTWDKTKPPPPPP